jgi:YopX protein
MIKFRERSERAWDIQNERMVYDPHLFLEPFNEDEKGKWIFYEDWMDHDDGISRLCYRMEYSGVKDIDGVKIYEGDIVRSSIHNPNHYKVEFIEGGFCCTHHLLDGYTIDINHFGCKIKVVGNIFQNPELLK